VRQRRPGGLRRRAEIAPGSLADRIREVCPPGEGATADVILAAAKALPEDVHAEIKRLRALGYIRVWGKTRARRYFWRR
jgi:hypothetical protein